MNTGIHSLIWKFIDSDVLFDLNKFEWVSLTWFISTSFALNNIKSSQPFYGLPAWVLNSLPSNTQLPTQCLPNLPGSSQSLSSSRSIAALALLVGHIYPRGTNIYAIPRRGSSWNEYLSGIDRIVSKCSFQEIAWADQKRPDCSRTNLKEKHMSHLCGNT